MPEAWWRRAQHALHRVRLVVARILLQVEVLVLMALRAGVFSHEAGCCCGCVCRLPAEVL